MIKFKLAGKVTEFDNGSMLNTEAILLEKTTGRRIADLAEAFDNRETEAICAYYWLALRRADGPEAAGKFTDLEFDLAEFVVELIGDQVTEDPTPAADPSSAADTDAHQVAALEPQHAAAI